METSCVANVKRGWRGCGTCWISNSSGGRIPTDHTLMVYPKLQRSCALPYMLHRVLLVWSYSSLEAMLPYTSVPNGAYPSMKLEAIIQKYHKRPTTIGALLWLVKKTATWPCASSQSVHAHRTHTARHAKLMAGSGHTICATWQAAQPSGWWHRLPL